VIEVVTEKDVADFLFMAGPKTITEVCDHFRISKGDAGRLLCKALHKGWVSKEKVELLGNVWRCRISLPPSTCH